MCFGLAGRGSQVAYGASLENWFPNGTMGSNPIPCATSQIPCIPEIFTEFLIDVRGNKPITSKNKKTIITALGKRVSNLVELSPREIVKLARENRREFEDQLFDFVTKS